VKLTYSLNCQTTKTIAGHASIRYQIRMPIPAATTSGPLRIAWDLIEDGHGAAASVTVQN
jgi:hypothetical protein